MIVAQVPRAVEVKFGVGRYNENDAEGEAAQQQTAASESW